MLRTRQLPLDASALAMQRETCHCVADIELDNRYNVLRAEEHARKEGKCGPEWSTDVATAQENADRNRYSSVVPWDHSRVLLPVDEGENDYINASWVELGSRTYIATQGPLKSTIHDFWQMVYAYGGDPAIIIMLTALHEHSVEKCAKYWPDAKHTPIVLPQERGFRFGLTISLEKYHVKNDQYKLGTFLITPSDPNFPPHKVQHVYYHTWLDLNKPSADADIRALIHLVNNDLRNPAAPQIVHCSAGIGRTGTFIAIDALLSRIDQSICPAVMPRFVPLWMGDTRILHYRSCPFTGATDGRGTFDNQAQMLSKFDISAVSAPPSVKMHSNSRSASHINSGLLSPAPEEPEKEKADSFASVRSTHTHDTEVPIDPSTAEYYRKLNSAGDGSVPSLPDTSQEKNAAPALSTPQEADEEGDAAKPVQHSSAKSGPVIKKVAAKITSVGPEVFMETPQKVDVTHWFDTTDPIMSTVRTMRKQRPKMVQGKQQLGYIYDQFEVGQQLARVSNQEDSNPSTPNRVTTMSSVPELNSNTARLEPKKPRKLFTFTHGVSSREHHREHHSHSIQNDTPRKSRLKSLFSGKSLN